MKHSRDRLILSAVAIAAVALIAADYTADRERPRPAAAAPAPETERFGAAAERYDENDLDWLFVAVSGGAVPDRGELRSLLDAADRSIVLSGADRDDAPTVGAIRVPAAATPTPQRIPLGDGAGHAVVIAADMSAVAGDALRRQILALKKNAANDYLIVAPRWPARDGAPIPPGRQRAAERWIDAGADLVVGSGGPGYRPVQRYRSKWILYGLGDLDAPADAARYRLIARLTRKPDGARLLRIYPLVADAAPRLGFADAKQYGEVYWRLVVDQWSPEDRWLKRSLSLGRDRFGRYLRLGDAS